MNHPDQPQRLNLKEEDYGGLDLSLKRWAVVSPPTGSSTQITPYRPPPTTAASFLTPETPTNIPTTSRNDGQDKTFKKEYESPSEAGPAPARTLFRPWDTPESLSPASDEAASSPTSSMTHSSPEEASKTASASASSPDVAGVPNRSPPSFPSQPSTSPTLHPIPFTVQPLVPFTVTSPSSAADNFAAFKSPTPVHGLEYSLAAPHPLKALENLTFQRPAKRKRVPEGAEASPLLAKKSRADSGNSREVEQQPCGVCGEPSTGQHYGAIVCEGCKVIKNF
jgi:hypothetical protein